MKRYKIQALFYRKITLILLFYLVLLRGYAQDGLYINEFMADPTPVKGTLPNAEYIELYNYSAKKIDLKGYKLVSRPDTTTLDFFELKPNSYVTIYTQKTGISFSKFGNILPVDKLIGLNNPGDTIQLLNAKNMVIDAVTYDLTYYEKGRENGGYSLERINPKAPCLLGNWRSSNDLNGGTPGKPNSVFEEKKDTLIPIVEAIFFKENSKFKTISLRFNKKMNILIAKDTSNFFVENQFFKDTNVVVKPFFNTVELTFKDSLPKDKFTKIVVKKMLKDCQDTPLSKNDTLTIKQPDKPSKDSIIINEILFNPARNGSRFLELFNASKTKVFDLKDLKIAKDTAQSSWLNIANNYLLFPQKCVVITDNPLDVQNRYAPPNFKMPYLKNRLPTWAADEGLALIANLSGSTIDSFSYNKNLHNPLIANTEGVSLERINPKTNASEKTNWQSAAKSVNYATPGYQNSQYLAADPSVKSLENDVFWLPKATFSPDDDGLDFLQIHYKLNNSGYLATITAFDFEGHFIQKIAEDEPLKTGEGIIKWDGETSNGLKARVGIYILLIELKNPNGELKKVKKTCAIMSKF